MNVPVPDATNRTIFVSRTKTQGYHFLPQVSDPKGKKEKRKRFCPVSLNSLARSRSKRSRKIQRTDGCTHERNNLNICVVNPIEHVKNVDKSREILERDRIQKSFAVIVEVVIVGRTGVLSWTTGAVRPRRRTASLCRPDQQRTCRIAHRPCLG